MFRMSLSQTDLYKRGSERRIEKRTMDREQVKGKRKQKYQRVIPLSAQK